MKEAIITTAAFIALTIAVVAAVLVGTSKSELAECNKWSQEADVYPGYFLAQWQKAQCDAHGVFISSPVK